MMLILGLLAFWSDPLPCTVDTFVLLRVGESAIWRVYTVGDVLLVGSDVGTAFYRLSEPERGPFAVLGGWWPPQFRGFIREALPPVVIRFSSHPTSVLHVARVDPASGVILDSLSIPGVPIVPVVDASPVLDGRFMLIVRAVTPEKRFVTLVFLFRLDPFALQDTFSLGTGDPSYGSPIRVWEVGQTWILAPRVPHNRGYPGHGGRDDLEGVVLLSPEGHILRNRLVPWPLFASPYLFCVHHRCALNAVPSPWTPPGVKGRIWLLSLPGVEILESRVTPDRTLWIPREDGRLEVNLDRAEGRFVPRTGRAATFPLPIPRGLSPIGAESDEEGVWMVLRPSPSRIRDPRTRKGPPPYWVLLRLTPRGTWARRFLPPWALIHFRIRGNTLTWAGWTSPEGLLAHRIRCPSSP